MADDNGERDWPLHLTDTIVRVVDQVRDKTTSRAIKVARVAVFGLIAAIVGSIALILLLIGALRALDRSMPGSVWSAYLVLSAVFLALGAFLLTKATSNPPRKDLR